MKKRRNSTNFHIFPIFFSPYPDLPPECKLQFSQLNCNHFKRIYHPETLQTVLNVLAWVHKTTNTRTERVHTEDALQRIPICGSGNETDGRLRGMSEALWKMAPERRTEPETARLRQVPPVTAEGYKKADKTLFVPAEVFAARRR